MKEESEKPGLKLNIQKTKIMASRPITSWQIVGEKVKTVADFIFLGSKITMDGDFEAQENKICHCFHFFPMYLPLSDGIVCHNFSFLNVEF